ncbi:hypothetical protein BKA93DRAFT_353247 [Sparassis latifolia]
MFSTPGGSGVVFFICLLVLAPLGFSRASLSNGLASPQHTVSIIASCICLHATHTGPSHIIIVLHLFPFFFAIFPSGRVVCFDTAFGRYLYGGSWRGILTFLLGGKRTVFRPSDLRVYLERFSGLQERKNLANFAF